MAAIASFELYAVDLPFRKPFRHAAAERNESSSLFLKCTTDTGISGFGETLPRDYVTGESRESAFAMLRDAILPRLVGQNFDSLDEAEVFLQRCDGQTPGWISADTPQTAAWCAVDLALLDAFGRAFHSAAPRGVRAPLPLSFRYSGVLSADKGLRLVKSALKQKLYGIRQVKLKVDDAKDVEAVRLLRRVFGRSLEVRVDANMAWNAAQAIEAMQAMARHGVRSFEQPVAAGDFAGMGQAVSATRLGVMADESFSTRESLRGLVEAKACTAVNVRISKCGGLIAATNRAGGARRGPHLAARLPGGRVVAPIGGTTATGPIGSTGHLR